MMEHSFLFRIVYLGFILSRDLVYCQWSSIRQCEQRYGHLVANGINFVAPVGGSPAVDREFAHMAAIGWDVGNDEIEWNCGGSLISKNFVLTAGHCTYWKGQPPTVVRLGDLDLSNDTDNEYAQQFQIAQIIRHPQYTSKLQYNDVALLRLNESVRLSDRVCPACLWTKNEVNFDTVEACGYGQIGYQEEKTPRLLKVSLNPVSNEFCSEFHSQERRLPNGIQPEQICAYDASAKMDTCGGDSGGPLQIKLLYDSHEHPFIIGVTSFGKGCATVSPGVYARVAPYTSWIASVVPDLLTDPKECAFHYANYREPERGTWQLSGNTIYIDGTKQRFGGVPQGLDPDTYKNVALKYLVHIGWTNRNNIDPSWSCFGSLITEEYVLTVASCLAKFKRSPDIIKPENDKTGATYRIKSVVIHPHFRESTLENDIALVLLEKEISFDKFVQPACLWDEPKIPDYLKFFGKEGVEIYGYEKLLAEKPVIQHIRILVQNASECSAFYQTRGIKIDYSTQVCYKNDLYLVPDYCEMAHGAPIRTYKQYENRDPKQVFWYIITMNSFGIDCGFGAPLINTKIFPYIDWIDSVIFNKQSMTTESIFYSDQQLFENDHCRTTAVDRGTCIKSENCPNVVELIKQNQAKFEDYVCGFDGQHNSLICCP